MKSKDISKFHFSLAGIKCFEVIYMTLRGDYYEALVDNIHIINATKFTKLPKIKDIKILRDTVKRLGKHFHKNGKPF